eukprot:COSAG06_NODE_2020_length_7835_cov_3.118795_2_plen_73_part_00
MLATLRPTVSLSLCVSLPGARGRERAGRARWLAPTAPQRDANEPMRHRRRLVVEFLAEKCPYLYMCSGRRWR